MHGQDAHAALETPDFSSFFRRLPITPMLREVAQHARVASGGSHKFPGKFGDFLRHPIETPCFSGTFLNHSMRPMAGTHVVREWTGPHHIRNGRKVGPALITLPARPSRPRQRATIERRSIYGQSSNRGWQAHE